MRVLILIPVLLLIVGASTMSAELSADAIMEKVCAIANQPSFKAKIEMQVKTREGGLPPLSCELFSTDKGNKNIIRYTSPQWLQGQAALVLNDPDNVWAYIPSTNKVLKLGGHVKKQNIQGSDFSYEDLCLGSVLSTSFSAARIENERERGVDYYKLDLTRKAGSSSAYSRLVMWVDKDTFIPVIIDYYGETDPTEWIKRLTRSNIKEIDGVPTATHLEMASRVKKSKTILRVVNIEYNLRLDEEMFTEGGLTRLRGV